MNDIVKISLRWVMIGFVLGLNVSCVEEFNFENESFDYVLVIDATLTNELKRQTIYINRAHQFDQDKPNKVTGATVMVTAGNMQLEFIEETPGTYVSANVFVAQPNVDYVLSVTTKNGNRYRSTTAQLTTPTQIDNVYAVRETNDDGVDGVSIYVDSYDPTNTSQYYRYDFEETFKVVAPLWKTQDAYVVSDQYPECIVALRPRSRDKITCYRSEASNNINVTTTVALNEDRVERYLVNFLSNQNYKISHRYSILARQYVITEQSYTYWNTLRNFIDKNSLFSEIQAGYVPGNIASESNPSEKVVGFFEVVSMASRRIYFNYTDFYQGEPLPPYAVPCTERAPDLFDISHNYMCGPLIDAIQLNGLVYLKDNEGEFPRGGPYIMVPRECGDCTALGETEPPEFWKEQ